MNVISICCIGHSCYSKPFQLSAGRQRGYIHGRYSHSDGKVTFSHNSEDLERSTGSGSTIKNDDLRRNQRELEGDFLTQGR